MTTIKVGFVLLSNSRNPIPSTRIASISMFPFLREQGFDPQVVFEPVVGAETPEVPDLVPRLVAEDFKVVVFQKVYGPSVEALARRLRAAGIRTVFSVCDVTEVEMARVTDATLVVTEFMKTLYPPELRAKIHVVHDGIEHPEQFKPVDSGHGGSASRPLRAVLVTSAHLTSLPVIGALPPWLQVTIVGRYFPTRLQRLRQARWNLAGQDSGARLDYLRFLASRRIKCVAWDPLDVYAQMRQADIGIIPIDQLPPHTPGAVPPSWKVKSENRLTMKMAVGLPVIASPIPSYEPVVEQGKNGFLAHTAADWPRYFEALRDPALRASMGAVARQTTLARYSKDEQARLLVAVLRELAAGAAGA